MKEYPLCPYCDESGTKEECDLCIDSRRMEQERKDEFRKEIVGKICTECNEEITSEQIDEDDGCIVSGSHYVDEKCVQKPTEYYHYYCRHTRR